MQEETRITTNATAKEAGMGYSKEDHCPSCGCPWFGSENLCGNGHRVCYACYQDWWLGVDYGGEVKRKELEDA